MIKEIQAKKMLPTVFKVVCLFIVQVKEGL